MTRLPQAPWTKRRDIADMLAAIDPDGGKCRFVGGAVRDTLRNLPVKDIDMATLLHPERVIERLAAASIKAVPTGLAHGTVTAVLPDGPVEITTLRRDIDTDGRRATVQFGTNWRDDAARRDFTINAIYADPTTLELFDPFGGEADLEAGSVRFIGDAQTRIREDYLRILRFFRFHARFGKGPPDAEALRACTAGREGLKGLSRERIGAELNALLALADPLPAARAMADAGIWAQILPEIDHDGLDRLAILLAREKEAHLAGDAIVRLAALLPRDPQMISRIAPRLRLSKKRAIALQALASQPRADSHNIRPIAYRIGADLAHQKAVLEASDSDWLKALSKLENWQVPRFPLQGRDLLARGMSAGPEISQTLGAIERRWIAEGFPDAERLDLLIGDTIAQQGMPSTSPKGSGKPSSH